MCLLLHYVPKKTANLAEYPLCYEHFDRSHFQALYIRLWTTCITRVETETGKKLRSQDRRWRH